MSMRNTASTNGKIDGQKLLGTYNGTLSSANDLIQRVKLHIAATTDLTDDAFAKQAFLDLDSLQCTINELDGLFNDYLQGK